MPSELYTDESGNTGTALLDAAQPIGVTAIIATEATGKLAIERGINEHARTLRRKLGKELKFSKLCSTPAGCSITATAIRIFDEVGVRVFFSLTEKRYLVASLVGEVFLDPLCTPGVPLDFLDQRLRRLAANLVYETCDDDILTEFHKSYLASASRCIVNVGQRIRARVALHPTADAEFIAKAMNVGIAHPYVPGLPPDVPRLLERPAAHTFTFIPLLAAVDRALQDTEQPATLIADEDRQFGELLETAVAFARDERLFPNGMSAYGVPGPIRCIRGRVEAQSHREFGLQMADLAAGLIGFVARKTLHHSPLNDLTEAWSRMLTVLRRSAPSAYWQVSERCLDTLKSVFLGATPASDNWWWTRT